MDKYTVIGGGQTWKMEVSDDQTIVTSGKQIFVPDLVRDGRHGHLLDNGKSYRIEWLPNDPDTNTRHVKVNGIVYIFSVQSEVDELLGRLGMNNQISSKSNSVKAPMPGLVLSVVASEGSGVAKGDTILILEAMKMENIIKAPISGSIRRIAVNKGQAVEKGQLLVEME